MYELTEGEPMQTDRDYETTNRMGIIMGNGETDLHGSAVCYMSYSTRIVA